MQINYTHLKAARIFCYNRGDDSRKILTGVYVDLVNKRLVATDGRRLAIIRSDDMATRQGDHDLTIDTSGFVLPAAFIDRIPRPSKKQLVEIFVDVPASASTWTDAGHLTCDLIQGTFPGFELVIPAADAPLLEIGFAHFDFGLLASFNKAFKMLGANNSMSVRRYGEGTDADKAVYVIRNESSASADNFYGLLMPMLPPRTTEKSRPDWLTFPAKQPPTVDKKHE